LTTGPLAHVFVPAYSTLNREIKINQPFSAILAWQKRRKVYFFVGILKRLGYSGHRFSSKENSGNMRGIATNQNILSYTHTKKKVKNLILSQFFYCSHKIKEPQGNSQGSKFWSSITDKIAQYLLSVGGVFVSFQPQKKTWSDLKVILSALVDH